MTDEPDLDVAELTEELSAFDQLLHRGEANPRTRSGIMTIEILDTTPDWARFRTRFENASRTFGLRISSAARSTTSTGAGGIAGNS